MEEYRYVLDRSWAAPRDRPRVLWVMLNPSTADDRHDDATLRRCVSFSRRWGASGLAVVNLYALRSTDPRGLWRHPDPVGPANDRRIAEQLRLAVAQAWTLVCAWGVHSRPDRAAAVLDAVRASGLTAYSLGRTRHDHPRHPLYLPATAGLERYEPAAGAERAAEGPRQAADGPRG